MDAGLAVRFAVNGEVWNTVEHSGWAVVSGFTLTKAGASMGPYVFSAALISSGIKSVGGKFLDDKNREMALEIGTLYGESLMQLDKLYNGYKELYQ